MFRLDPFLFDHEKIDKKPVIKLFQRNICYIDIKDFLLKQASFFKYFWEIIAYIEIIGKDSSGLDIWPETPNLSTNTKDIILTT